MHMRNVTNNFNFNLIHSYIFSGDNLAMYPVSLKIPPLFQFCCKIYCTRSIIMFNVLVLKDVANTRALYTFCSPLRWKKSLYFFLLLWCVDVLWETLPPPLVIIYVGF